MSGSSILHADALGVGRARTPRKIEISKIRDNHEIRGAHIYQIRVLPQSRLTQSLFVLSLKGGYAMKWRL